MNNLKIREKVSEAKSILAGIGMPKAQQNERTALCLLALLNLAQDKPWNAAQNPLMGITPIMSWVTQNYKKTYAPNTRETFQKTVNASIS